MKKLASIALTGVLLSSFALSASAQTPTPANSTAGSQVKATTLSLQEKLLAKKVKSIKQKTASTKSKISTNKKQVNQKINSIKKERKIIKQKRLNNKARKVRSATTPAR